MVVGLLAVEGLLVVVNFDVVVGSVLTTVEGLRVAVLVSFSMVVLIASVVSFWALVVVVRMVEVSLNDVVVVEA